jgi:hypothetical protein
VLFENANKVFDLESLYMTSFINTDLTEVRFSGRLKWTMEKPNHSTNFEAVKAVYRNLRENY